MLIDMLLLFITSKALFISRKVPDQMRLFRSKISSQNYLSTFQFSIRKKPISPSVNFAFGLASLEAQFFIYPTSLLFCVHGARYYLSR